MAKKNSPGCVTAIIGLIALAMAAKYWYVLIAIGFVALAIWLIAQYFQAVNINAPMNSTKTSSELHLRVICDACEDFPSTLIEDTNNPILESDSGSLQYRTPLQVIPSASSISTSQQNGGDAEDEEQNINRLGAAASVHAETLRILDTENSDMRERVDLVNAEIELILATEKDAIADVSAVEKAAVEVTVKIKAAEEAVMQERVSEVKAVVEIDPAKEKAAAEVALKQKSTEHIEPIDNPIDLVLAPVETQWILDSENMGTWERIAQENAVIEQVLETEKTAAAVDPEQRAVEEEKQNIELGFQGVTVPAAVTSVINTVTHTPTITVSAPTPTAPVSAATFFYTFDKEEVESNRQHDFFISKFSINTATNSPTITVPKPTPTILEKEVAEAMKQYDFVFTNQMGLLKTSDQWINEATQKRRLRQGSTKSFEWLHPFLPLEVINLSEIKQLLELGPKSASEVAKKLRAQIRERKKDEQPYYDLHNALFSTPQLMQIQMWEPQYATTVIAKQLRVLIRERRKNKQPCDNLLRALYGTHVASYFVSSLTFEGPIDKIAHHVDIRELRNIHIDFLTMGYRNIESLLITDIKWLIEAFGEPVSHQTFDALWPNIRLNTISRYCWEELRISNKTARTNWRSEKSMIEWLSSRVRGWWVRRNEWLAQKVDREAQLAARPVIVKTASNVKQRRHAIPTPPKHSHSFSLDMSSIETKLAETVAVSAILKDIFREDTPVLPQTAVPESTTTEASIAGLDAESSAFMQALASKHIWARYELEKLAADHCLMLDGTLDSINDASFDHFGGPFFEGNDPIEINPEFAKEITA